MMIHVAGLPLRKYHSKNRASIGRTRSKRRADDIVNLQNANYLINNNEAIISKHHKKVIKNFLKMAHMDYVKV